MDRRFSLAAVLVILIGGAIYLWLNPDAPVDTTPAPNPSSEARPTPIAPEPSAPLPVSPTGPAFYVLAITWFPGFCELHPAVPECRGTTDYQNSHFALHGLWPGDEYCGVSDVVRSTDENGRWDRLPAVELTDATRAALRRAMPGTRSQLERHEWIAHGTCAGMTAETYFRNAAALIETINASPVRDLFVANIGEMLPSSAVRSSFDKSFGSPSGRRVRMACEELDGHTTLTELTLNLYGTLGKDSLRAMLAAARTRSPGCPEGLVNR